jgi:hypothetical protein
MSVRAIYSFMVDRSRAATLTFERSFPKCGPVRPQMPEHACVIKLCLACQAAMEHQNQQNTGGRIMPRGDGTGPMGMGSKRGRTTEYCSGSDTSGSASAQGRDGARQDLVQQTPRRGNGRDMGPDGCRGAWRQAPRGAGPVIPISGIGNPDMEQQDLQQQASALQSALDAINQRLSKLEHKTSQE